MVMNTDKPSLPLLAAVSGMSSFSMAIILPALPALATFYATDYAGIQLLVSAYVLGLAIAQPLWGHITDRVGRRPVMLWGFALFIAASAGCLLEPGLPMLTALRVLQAAGACSGTVVSRAVIRDTYAVEDGARAMSWLTIGLGAAPIIAPMIGGALMLYSDTFYLFAVMAVSGAVLWILLYLKLPETLAPDAERPAWSSLFGSYGTLLRLRGFVGYTAIFGFIQGGFFAFLAVGAAVFQDSFGLGPAAFGTIWGVMGVSYVLGALGGGRVSASRRRPLLLPVCVFATLLCGLGIALLDILFGAMLLGVLLPLFMLMVVSGAATPLVVAGAVYQEPRLAGTASGLASALAMATGGAFTVAAGVLYKGDFTPIAVLIALSTILTVGGWLVVRRV